MKKKLTGLMACLMAAASLLVWTGCGDDIHTTKTITTHEQEDPQMTSPGREVVE